MNGPWSMSPASTNVLVNIACATNDNGIYKLVCGFHFVVVQTWHCETSVAAKKKFVSCYSWINQVVLAILVAVYQIHYGATKRQCDIFPVFFTFLSFRSGRKKVIHLQPSAQFLFSRREHEVSNNAFSRVVSKSHGCKNERCERVMMSNKFNLVNCNWYNMKGAFVSQHFLHFCNFLQLQNCV